MSAREPATDAPTHVYTREGKWFGRKVTIACDGRCDKAWGINGRPSEQLSTNPDDVVWAADSELGTAPDDPGTYEGGHAKPTTPEERLNKWCARECERSGIFEIGEAVVLKEWSKPRHNIPRKADSDE